MKKTLMIISIILVNSANGFVENNDASYKNYSKQIGFLDAARDEYSYGEDQNDIDEYDQNICDDVCPPKISPAKALLTELLGSMLIRYIAMRELARGYFQDIKDVLAKWYNSIIKM